MTIALSRSCLFSQNNLKKHGLFCCRHSCQTCCLCLLSFLMSSDAKEHFRDKLWLRRSPVRVPLFFPKPCIGAQASQVSVYLSAFTFLLVVFIEFLPCFCLVSQISFIHVHDESKHYLSHRFAHRRFCFTQCI